MLGLAGAGFRGPDELAQRLPRVAQRASPSVAVQWLAAVRHPLGNQWPAAGALPRMLVSVTEVPVRASRAHYHYQVQEGSTAGPRRRWQLDLENERERERERERNN
jgi:hypothetical protein